MYNLYGYDHNVRNICKLSRPYMADGQINLADVRSAYWKFLDDYQPLIPHPVAFRSMFVSEQNIEEKLADAYKTAAVLNDRNQSALIAEAYSDDAKQEKECFTRRALSEIERVAKPLHHLLNFVIHSVFFRNSTNSGGGSTSNAIGVIWLNNRAHWSVTDLAELLIHELTHNLVFVDELCDLHMRDYGLLQK